MAAMGLRRVRTLVQMRRDLPLDASARDGIPRVHTRPFEVDRDSESLLAVNNAAFAWHPEQGNWDGSRLGEALAEPWVDRSGILVHDADGAPAAPGIDGFCWTRIHPGDDPETVAAGDPPQGEIWVIATDPRVHGTRLGPAMVEAGLDFLASRGLRTANLYTEADNASALRMYERMGFDVVERRGGYR